MSGKCQSCKKFFILGDVKSKNSDDQIVHERCLTIGAAGAAGAAAPPPPSAIRVPAWVPSISSSTRIQNTSTKSALPPSAPATAHSSPAPKAVGSVAAPKSNIKEKIAMLSGKSEKPTFSTTLRPSVVKNGGGEPAAVTVSSSSTSSIPHVTPVMLQPIEDPHNVSSTLTTTTSTAPAVAKNVADVGVQQGRHSAARPASIMLSQSDINYVRSGGATHTWSEGNRKLYSMLYLLKYLLRYIYIALDLEEKIAFSMHINQCLARDPHASRHLPLDIGATDLFARAHDGLLLCKLINLAQPDTIDERALNIKESLNVYQKTENVNLALNAAKAIGCQVVNIGAQDIIDGR